MDQMIILYNVPVNLSGSENILSDMQGSRPTPEIYADRSKKCEFGRENFENQLKISHVLTSVPPSRCHICDFIRKTAFLSAKMG